MDFSRVLVGSGRKSRVWVRPGACRLAVEMAALRRSIWAFRAEIKPAISCAIRLSANCTPMTQKSRRALSAAMCQRDGNRRSEEHTSELQSLMRISYAVFCLKKKKNTRTCHKYQKEYNNINNW